MQCWNTRDMPAVSTHDFIFALFPLITREYITCPMNHCKTTIHLLLVVKDFPLISIRVPVHHFHEAFRTSRVALFWAWGSVSICYFLKMTNIGKKSISSNFFMHFPLYSLEYCSVYENSLPDKSHEDSGYSAQSWYHFFARGRGVRNWGYLWGILDVRHLLLVSSLYGWIPHHRRGE